jgi:hypothetical protein
MSICSLVHSALGLEVGEELISGSRNGVDGEAVLAPKEHADRCLNLPLSRCELGDV